MIARAPQTADIPALWALWKEAFGDTDGFIGGFFATAFSAERSLCLTGDDGEMKAALYWMDCERPTGGKVAYLYAVATAKRFRGQGLCRMLMEQTHRILSQIGYAGAILVPADAGLWRMYERMGYRVCSHVAVREALPMGTCRLVPVGTEEYAAHRRLYMPVGGLLQERESMAFLALQAELFLGDGFVLAARREGGRLIGKEILGDHFSLPQIVGALGCQSGVFTVQGGVDDVPFAAYFALNGDPMPRYLGFAFD